jgi:DNA-binding XRE family transcriptional regulator
MAKTSKSSFAVAWGKQLKLFREAASMTQEGLADRIGYARSTIASLESGAFPPGVDICLACDNALDLKGHLIELRKDLIDVELFGPWYRDWVQIERAASVIRGVAVVLLPGLLQTRAYALAVLEGDEDAITSRMDRQAIFDKENPPTVRYVLDQQIFERPTGGAEVMIEQIEHLEELMATGRVSIQISPAGSIPGLNSSFDLATVDGETLGYLDGTTKGTVLTQREDVLELEAVYDRILAEALPSAMSLEMLRKLKERWQS